MDNTDDKGVFSFAFDKKESKKGQNMEAKREKRRQNFLKESNAEDLKRKRENKHVTLRKEVKQQKFIKRRKLRMGAVTDESKQEEEIKSDDEYTVEEAEKAYHEDMDMMDYFQILSKTDFKLVHFLQLTSLVLEKEDHKILFGIVGIRKLLSIVSNPPIQSVIDANLLPVFLSLVTRSDFPRLQFEALWWLTNIASGKAEHCQALMDKGAIAIFITLLGSEQTNIIEQAIWALGNIAGEDSYFKSMILREGALLPLAQILAKSQPDTMLARNSIWCITNLLRGKPMPAIEEILAIIPTVCETLKNNTKKEILTDAVWGVSYISDAGEKAIVKIIECEACPAIAQMLGSKYNNVILPAIRTFGNFVTGEDELTQVVIDSGALPLLDLWLESADIAVKKEAWWTLSNICAGTTLQVAQIIETGIFDKLIKLVDDEVFEIKREAGWSISNTTALKNKEVIQKVVEKDGIKAMCKVLSDNIDPKTAVVLLEGIKNILEVGQEEFLNEHGENPFSYMVEEAGGLDTIEELQTAQNQYVYELAVSIIEEFFQVEEIDLKDEPINNNFQLQF